MEGRSLPSMYKDYLMVWYKWMSGKAIHPNLVAPNMVLHEYLLQYIIFEYFTLCIPVGFHVWNWFNLYTFLKKPSNSFWYLTFRRSRAVIDITISEGFGIFIIEGLRDIRHCLGAVESSVLACFILTRPDWWHKWRSYTMITESTDCIYHFECSAYLCGCQVMHNMD